MPTVFGLGVRAMLCPICAGGWMKFARGCVGAGLGPRETGCGLLLLDPCAPIPAWPIWLGGRARVCAPPTPAPLPMDAWLGFDACPRVALLLRLIALRSPGSDCW